MQKKLLIIGKRSGILQWYENILAAAHQSPDYEIQGFALNHNNTTDRFLKKLLPNKDIYTANLLKKKLQTFQPDLILIADLFILMIIYCKFWQTFHAKSTLDW